VRQGAGGDVIRVAPWKGDPKVALLTPLPGRPPPLRDQLERSLDALAARGYAVVLTGALDAGDLRTYVAAGFEEHARLHVLGRSLDDLPRAPRAHVLQRARRRDRPEVHEVDAAAFTEFWQLGEVGLDDALGATPEARFRVARLVSRSARLKPRSDSLAAPRSGVVIGYAICGRAGYQGYVQRLAVDPQHRRAGLGAALVLDGLNWMKRHSIDDAVVNTQVDNDAALALYERLGFRRRGAGLRVLRRGLANGGDLPIPGSEL
jgi:ribosomal protein S18 acetylase RimI-like enzyme